MKQSVFERYHEMAGNGVENSGFGLFMGRFCGVNVFGHEELCEIAREANTPYLPSTGSRKPIYRCFYCFTVSSGDKCCANCGVPRNTWLFI